MKRNHTFLHALLPAFTGVSTILIWGLDRLASQVVYNDSAWQALDANGASWEHTFAEGIHQIPFLTPAWVVLCLALNWMFFRKKQRPQNNNLNPIENGAPFSKG